MQIENNINMNNQIGNQNEYIKKKYNNPLSLIANTYIPFPSNEKGKKEGRKFWKIRLSACIIYP